MNQVSFKFKTKTLKHSKRKGSNQLRFSVLSVYTDIRKEPLSVKCNRKSSETFRDVIVRIKTNLVSKGFTMRSLYITHRGWLQRDGLTKHIQCVEPFGTQIRFESTEWVKIDTPIFYTQVKTNKKVFDSPFTIDSTTVPTLTRPNSETHHQDTNPSEVREKVQQSKGRGCEVVVRVQSLTDGRSQETRRLPKGKVGVTRFTPTLKGPCVGLPSVEEVEGRGLTSYYTLGNDSRECRPSQIHPR